MKYIFIFIFIFNSTLFSEESSSLSWKHNYTKSLELANEESKNVLLIVTTDNCRWCGRLVHLTMSAADIIEYSRKNLILVKINHKDKKLPKQFRTKIYPTSYLLDKNGKILSKLYGSALSDKYLKFLKGK